MHGGLTRLSALRPYPRGWVVERLERMWEGRLALTPTEQAVLASTLEPLREPRRGLSQPKLTYQVEEGPKRAQVEAELRGGFLSFLLRGRDETAEPEGPVHPAWYPDYRIAVDDSYTHDGENLAYAPSPNTPMSSWSSSRPGRCPP